MGLEAEAAFIIATRVDPEYAQAWYNLGDLLDDQGRPDAAIECLRKALRVAPDYADAMFNLALAPARHPCPGCFLAAAQLLWRAAAVSVLSPPNDRTRSGISASCDELTG